MLLICRDGKRMIVSEEELERGFHTHKGFVSLEEHEGFAVTEEKPLDLLEFMRRGPQVIRLEDGMFMIGLARLTPSSRVLEAGSGSGALTIMLANFLREGIVYSYEKREDFLKIARENVQRAGLSNKVVFKLKDVYEGIDERDLDAIFLDLPEPWLALKSASKALREGGVLISYLPTVEQVKRLTIELRKSCFSEPEVYRLWLEEWRVEPTRPKTKGLIHKAFIVRSFRLSNSLEYSKK